MDFLRAMIIVLSFVLIITTSSAFAGGDIELGVMLLVVFGPFDFIFIYLYRLFKHRSKNSSKSQSPQSASKAAFFELEQESNAGEDRPVADESDFEEAEPGIKDGTSEENSKKCPHCGADISGDMVFCVECGHRL